MEDTTTQLPPDPRPSPSLRGTRDLFDINILPERFRRRRLTLAALLPWLLLAILLATIYPTYLYSISSQNDFKNIQLELAKIQSELALYQSNDQEWEELQTQIAAVTAKRDAILQSLGGVQLSTGRWSPILFQIEDQVSRGIQLTELSQQGETIRLEGTSDRYTDVISLLDSLLSLDSLRNVKIDSIERIEVEDLPTPASGIDGASLATSPGQPTGFSFSILATAQWEVAP